MLSIVHSTHNKMFGVQDIDPTNGYPTKTVIPFRYVDITFQKSIITGRTTPLTVRTPFVTYDIYSLEGNPLIRNVINPIALNNNMLLARSVNNKCYLMDCNTMQPLISNAGFESILYFMGSNPNAMEYPLSIPLPQIFSSIDYLQNGGAFIERIVCLKSNGLWGIYDLKTKKMIFDYIITSIDYMVGMKLKMTDIYGKNYQY